MTKNENKHINRSEEITIAYFAFLDQHIVDVVDGRVSDFMGINQIAQALYISHTHLTDTIQKTKGEHPCYFYDLKIVEQAKKMLRETDQSIAEIAKILTYDPSNFSKFFKKFVGQTPQQWRIKVKSS